MNLENICAYITWIIYIYINMQTYTYIFGILHSLSRKIDEWSPQRMPISPCRTRPYASVCIHMHSHACHAGIRNQMHLCAFKTPPCGKTQRITFKKRISKHIQSRVQHDISTHAPCADLPEYQSINENYQTNETTFGWCGFEPKS